MLCWFLLHNKMNQLYVYTYPLPVEPLPLMFAFKKPCNKDFPDFPGSPIVGTLCFHCRGLRLNPRLEN